MMIFFLLTTISLNNSNLILSLYLMIMLSFLLLISLSKLNLLSLLLLLELIMLLLILTFMIPQSNTSFNMITLFSLFSLAVGEACLGLGMFLKFIRHTHSNLFFY